MAPLLLILGCLPDYPDWRTKADADEAGDTAPGDTAPDDTGDTGCEETLLAWPDGDGDGYGDPATEPETVCAVGGGPPDGYAADDTDCDDADADVFPGALEICDGKASDCDAASSWVADDGLASFRDANGEWLDLSETLGAGALGSPAGWDLPGAGVLRFCERLEPWSVTLSTEWDLELAGYSSERAVVLSGGGVGSVLRISGDETAVSIHGMTLKDGAATEVDRYDATVGGGVHCRGDVDLSLTEVTVSWSGADGGGGIYSDGCDLTLDTVDLLSNSADFGGGLFIEEGAALAVTGSTFQHNSAENGGAAAVISGAAEISASTVADNNADGPGGGLYLTDGAAAALVQVSLTGNASQTPVGGGAAWLEAGATLTGTGCDFKGNTPDDVSVNGQSFQLDSGDDFECGSDECK